MATDPSSVADVLVTVEVSFANEQGVSDAQPNKLHVVLTPSSCIRILHEKICDKTLHLPDIAVGTMTHYERLSLLIQGMRDVQFNIELSMDSDVLQYTNGAFDGKQGFVLRSPYTAHMIAFQTQTQQKMHTPFPTVSFGRMRYTPDLLLFAMASATLNLPDQLLNDLQTALQRDVQAQIQQQRPMIAITQAQAQAQAQAQSASATAAAAAAAAARRAGGTTAEEKQSQKSSKHHMHKQRTTDRVGGHYHRHTPSAASSKTRSERRHRPTILLVD